MFKLNLNLKNSLEKDINNSNMNEPFKFTDNKYLAYFLPLYTYAMISAVSFLFFDNPFLSAFIVPLGITEGNIFIIIESIKAAILKKSLKNIDKVVDELNVNHLSVNTDNISDSVVLVRNSNTNMNKYYLFNNKFDDVNVVLENQNKITNETNYYLLNRDEASEINRGCVKKKVLRKVDER